jgi:hypothetical protein
MTEAWPPLPLADWRDTCETLHRYAQVVGKIQLALTPTVNHFWNVGFHLTARGLATPAMEYEGRALQITLDLLDHRLLVQDSQGQSRTQALGPRAVADFTHDVRTLLDALGVHVAIRDQPCELSSDPIPLSRDRMHAAYDPAPVTRFFRILSCSSAVMEEFRARFVGKCSPVGFYWGTFDLALARYSGRRAPTPPQGGAIEREAFSHEVNECGFWPGDARHPDAAFYTMHVPRPEGFERAPVRPDAAFWDPGLGCYLLPYDDVRSAPSPRATLLDFFQATYEAGADRAGWDRGELERPQPRAPEPLRPAEEAERQPAV